MRKKLKGSGGYEKRRVIENEVFDLLEKYYSVTLFFVISTLIVLFVTIFIIANRNYL